LKEEENRMLAIDNETAAIKVSAVQGMTNKKEKS